MKPFALLVSALATLAVAAPAAPSTDLETRAFQFDVSRLNNLKSFQQVNLNYLLNINAVQLHLLQNLAQVNNFNVLQFQPLFNRQAFDVAGLLELQVMHTFLQFHQLGLFNGFDLSGLQLGHLNLGLLNNVGVVNLGDFVLPNVVPQVQTVASQPAVAFNPVLNAPVVDVGNSPNAGVASDVVTADEQEAQEGRSSLSN